MATDKSEPRVTLIFKIGLLAVVVLIGLHGALSTYFDFAVQGEEHRKFGEIKADGLLSLRAAERDRLNAGSMPIDKAMDQVAHQGRKNAAPDFSPSFSKDVSALAGWVKMPVEVPAAMMAASMADAGAPPAGGPSAAAVGGGAKAADAGAPKTKP